MLLTDVGFGVSQVLPVVTQCFYSAPESTLILEQPEIHLHPAVQAGLADLFIEAALQLALVPRLATGRFDIAELERLLGPSRVGDTPMEGLVLRHTERPGDRAKLVRPEFLQAIGEHWRSQPVELNRLAGLNPRGPHERV